MGEKRYFVFECLGMNKERPAHLMAGRFCKMEVIMYRKRHRRGRRLASVILAALMVTTAIPAQAAEFGAPENLEDIFSSGEEDSVTGTDDGTATAASSPETGTQDTTSPISEGTVTPTVTPSADDTPTVTPLPSETPIPSVTPALSVTPTPAPTPTINPEKEVMLRFIDGEGNECEQLRTVLEWNESLILPNVPDSQAPDLWKLEKDEKLNDAITLKGGDLLTLKKGESWNIFIQNGILNFYMPKKYTISLYNNSGTGVFPNGILQVYETNTAILPDMPYSKYINYGWTDTKGSSEVKYDLNSEYTVLGDTNFYIVRRTALQVNFMTNTGASNSNFTSLNQKIGKGLTVKMPEVPAKTKYQALGWSKSKNATKATYKVSQEVKVSSTLNLYAVYKKLPYKVSFNNNSGTSTSKTYTALMVYASRNQTVTLPAVPKAKGYTNLGWTTVKGDTTVEYNEGDTVKITKSVQFYAVRRKSKYYTVNYYLGNGSSNSAYKKLSQTVEEGTVITFAKVPARTGYVNLGWSTSKNATKATTKTTYTVNKNVNFYAVQKKAVLLTLRRYDGSVWQKTTLAKGSTYSLPGVRDAEGYTFMGWSSKPMQSVNPEYEAEEKITVNGNMNLYAVVFNRSTEKDLTEAELPQVDIYKYKQVIFVGDSRTEFMENVLKGMGESAIKNVKFVCSAGKKLDWLTTTGWSQLYAMVQKDTNSILSKKTAVIFNFGVNDLSDYADYVEYYNWIAPQLKGKGCELYFMSVNPLNRTMLSNTGRADRSEAAVRSFNDYMKVNLSSAYTYIDMYSYLKSTGYSFASDHYGAGTIDDGLHYTAKTYKRIYAKCINSLRVPR